MVCALGAQAHLLGVSRYCTQPPALQSLPRVGGILDPNLEAIDALAPELILWQGKAERLEELAQLRGYRLESFRLESFADVYASVRRLGALLGRVEAAEVEVERLREAVQRAGQGAPQPAPRVLLVYDRQAGELGQLASAGPGTFLSECLEAAGGVNCLDEVPAGSWPLLAPEVPFAERPDVILELSSRPLSAAEAGRLRDDWSRFEDIPAVAAGRVAVVCGEELLLPGPRLDQTVAKMARALRGERDVGLAAEAPR
jgi:iron complex transport system substrate-binding protein